MFFSIALSLRRSGVPENVLINHVVSLKQAVAIKLDKKTINY